MLNLDKMHQIAFIDVDSGIEVVAYYETWKEANEAVKTYQKNAITAWHVSENYDEN